MLNLAALYDPKKPLRQIAPRLHPYLRTIVEQFQPEVLTLFGSYAYGQPSRGSDIDLLVVKPLENDALSEMRAIRASLWPLMKNGEPMDIELLVESTERHRMRLAEGGSFYSEINKRGLNLLMNSPQKTSETNPEDWYAAARQCLPASDLVYADVGPNATCIELLHEAVERYMKGWLVGQSWTLIRTHNLTVLLAEMVSRDASFGEFLTMAIDLTDQFFLQHYPGNDVSSVGQNYDQLRTGVERLRTKIGRRDA